MAKNKIAALISSHIDGNEEQMLSIALQAAAAEARAGNTEDAALLKRLVQKARDKRSRSSVQAPIPMARAHPDLEGLVDSSYPSITLSSMVMAEDVRSKIDRILKHQIRRADLRARGMVPMTRLLLVGPPGTGKTMTASVIASELKLPLFTVKLDSLFSRFLGETASKLRVLFDQIASVRGVYLLDEFDAVGARRGDPNDVGEMRRIMNSILSFMEEPNSTDSPVVAATNHPGILDGALARRFDELIEYRLPDREAAKAIVMHRLGPFNIEANTWDELSDDLDGLSQGELTISADIAVRDAILEDCDHITTVQLQHILQNRRQLKDRFDRNDRN